MEISENTIYAEWVLTPEGWKEKQVISVDVDTGQITSVEPVSSVEEETGEASTENVAVVPGFVNAHSHAFQFGLRGRCQEAANFDDWVSSCLYPLVGQMDTGEIVERSEKAFREMIRTGITCVGEFHYIHNGPDGKKRGNEIDRAVIEAARRAGLRVGFIRAFYDREGPSARKRFLEEPEAAVAHYRVLAEEHEDDPFVNVLPGPHSVHGASPEMVRRGAELAGEFEVPYHIHVSEQVSEVEDCREKHDVTPLALLQETGAFNSWFVGVHGCWLSEEEVTDLAREGLGLVTCPTTNLTLGDGTTPLQEFFEQGGRFALGSDSHQRIDMLEEARLAEWLQRIDSLEMNVLGNQKPLPETLFVAMTETGRELLGFDSGGLVAGAPADFVGLSLSDLETSDSGSSPPSLEEVLFSKSAVELVEKVWVGGKQQL